jgi:PEP-CTERM motif-containing protein
MRAVSMLSVLALAWGAAIPASADPIAITRGALTFNGSFFEPLTIAGDRGFTFTATIGEGAVDFVPACGVECESGRTFSLGAFWSGSDLLGTATLDGRRFDDVGGLNSDTSAEVRFTGTMTVPLLGGGRAVTVSAPFAFEGTLFSFGPTDGFPAGTLSLAGGGIARGTFSNTQGTDEWNLDRMVFQLGDGAETPEPATLLLTATGAAGVLVRRRRSRQ